MGAHAESTAAEGARAMPTLRVRTAPRLAMTVGGAGLAIAVTLAVAIALLGLNAADRRLMLWLLPVSATVALAAGALVIRLSAGRRWDRVGARLAVGQVVGALVAVTCVLPTALVMFFSRHDRDLLLVLVGYSLAIALVFSLAVAGRVGATLRTVREGAARMAAGDLSARVPIARERDLAELGLAFNAMAERLDASFVRQREMEEARQGLITAVSHDLRTPVASLRVMVEAIADGVADDPETIRRYVGTMEREIVHLGRLIDDLFEMARLDAGQIALRLEPTPIAALIGETIDALAAQATRQGIALRVRVEGEPAPVLVDPDRIQRVLYNLVQNAIRHTPAEGAVTVAAVGLGPNVRVDVRDTGEGIAPADLPHVFDRFYRGDKARAREAHAGHRAGAGLGLAIARRLVESHGGRVWVAQPPDGGSVFSFTLPTAPSA